MCYFFQGSQDLPFKDCLHFHPKCNAQRQRSLCTSLFQLLRELSRRHPHSTTTLLRIRPSLRLRMSKEPSQGTHLWSKDLLFPSIRSRQDHDAPLSNVPCPPTLYVQHLSCSFHHRNSESYLASLTMRPPRQRARSYISKRLTSALPTTNTKVGAL